MWITPSGVPRYKLRTNQLVRVDLKTGKAITRIKPSTEHLMHRSIYNACPDVNAVVHTHSPYTLGVSISSEFVQVVEESRIVVGDPFVIMNYPSGSNELATSVAGAFQNGALAVIVRNHGVVTAGKSLHHARSIVESLEEWAKILTVARVFGGPKHVL